jgi:thiol-disulfide isomerase/thioredoxin
MTHIIENIAQLENLSAEHSIHILYFTTPSCNVCKSVFPQLETLMEAYPFPIFKINAESLETLAGQHLVFTVPTILVMHEGKEVLRESRFIDFSKIERILNLLKD